MIKRRKKVNIIIINWVSIAGRGVGVRVSNYMNGIKQKSRRRRQKKRIQRHKRSVLAVSAVILLLVVVVSASSMTLRARDKSYQAQEMELKEQNKGRDGTQSRDQGS